MSATPVINNLQEGRSMVELISGLVFGLLSIPRQPPTALEKRAGDGDNSISQRQVFTLRNRFLGETGFLEFSHVG